jgi:hypothetical protein
VTRALRAGSWNNNQDNARCGNRNRNNPNNRNNNSGFRVICASHIFPHLQRRRCSGAFVAHLLRALRPSAALEALPVMAADQGLRPEAQD